MLPLVLPLAAHASYCSTLTGCASCIDAESATGSSCNWCNKDSACHEVGSLASKCTLSSDCVSLSSLSTCHGSSVEACPASDLLPEQVHIAFDGHGAQGWPTGMSVSWFTARNVSAPSVAFGTSAAALTSSAPALTTRYLAEQWGQHHRARLLGLRPSTKYFYRPLPGGAVRSFVTAASASSGTVALSVFGDLGYQNSSVRPMAISGVSGLVKHWSASYTQQTMARLAASRQIDAVWHLGDIGYIDDSAWHELGRFTYEETYNGFMEWMEPIASTIPYMVSAGNHESECHSPICLEKMDSLAKPLANFSAFSARWAMPSAASGGAANMWYSWNLGAVHFVSANSETDWPGAEEETTGDSHNKKLPAGGFGAPGEYLGWLEADLAAANASRATRPWIVAGGHRPFAELNASHGALFAKYKVDAYVCGHTHSYARETWSFPGDSPGDDGPGWRMLSVVVGGAGSDEQAQAPPPAATDRGHGQSSYRTARYASGLLKASAAALDWQLIDSEAGTILDHVTLTAPGGVAPGGVGGAAPSSAAAAAAVASVVEAA